MGDIPIIGQSKPKDPEAEAYAALSEEDKEQLRALAAEQTDTGESVATAFLIILHHDGRIDVNSDISAAYSLARPAGVDDVIAGASVAISDVQASKTAQAAAMATMQLGQAAQRQAMQQQQAAQMAQKVQASRL